MDHQKSKLSGRARWAIIGVLIFFSFQLAVPALLSANRAEAIFGLGDLSITVGDIPALIRDAISNALKTARDIVFKNVLKSYLNNLAYNYAVKLATGKSGQKPLFVVNPKKLLQQAGDAAAGDFLDSLVSSWAGKSHCQGFSDKRCASDSQCDPVELACPTGIFHVSCSASIENKNKCLAAGCIVMNCTQEDINNNACPHEPPEGYVIEAQGAPECISTFSLCQPRDLTVKVKLNVLARQAALGETPNAEITGKCPLSDIIDTVEQGVTDWDPKAGKFYLVEFSKTFNPQSTQLGAYLEILNKTEETKAIEEAANKFAQGLAGEFESVRELISGAVKTPAKFLENAGASIFGESSRPYLTYTGTAIADAVGVFTNTLTSKLMERLFKGITPGTTTRNRVGVGSNAVIGSSSGVTAAKILFADLQQTSYSVGGSTDILSKLASCPDGNDPSPDTCVIDSRFRTAVEQQMTLRDAMAQGLVDGAKPFGFDSNGREPEYYNGYPYRSLLILRTYRIIPVGWELAAEYMQQYANGNYSLNTLVQAYDDQSSPFYRLVDPNWVLKSPDVFCAREGAGPKLLSSTSIRNEDTNLDTKVDTKDAAGTVITRQDDYCADEQLCLLENEDGSCKKYGYCIEEKPTWKFNGTACGKQYASCTTLESSGGGQVSYVLNSVNKNGCNSGNAGCQWYCQDYSQASGRYTCTSARPPSGGNKISFNSKVAACNASAEGCNEFIRTAKAGANYLLNSDFESINTSAAAPYDGIKDSANPDAFTGWLYNATACGDIGYASSDTYDGFTAVRLHSAAACGGGEYRNGHFYSQVVDSGYLTNGRTFTMSFYAKRSAEPGCTATNGKVSVDLLRFYDVPDVTNSAATAEISPTDVWTRYTVSGTFPNVAESTWGNPWLRTFVLPSFSRTDGDTCDLMIDNVQLEEGNTTSFKTYEDSPKTYLKQAPAYLGCTGGATDAAACKNYALSCTEAEVGCEAYTSIKSGKAVTGVVSNPNTCNPSIPGSCDQCPKEFAGCQAYRELAIDRMPMRPAVDPVSIVATTGQTCNATAVGCEEYTNLEVVAQGGEGKEFYSAIRTCVNEDAADPTIATYYTWEGSNEFGYQLREYRLKVSNLDEGGGVRAPCTNVGAEGDPRLGPNDWPTCIDDFDYNGDAVIDFPAQRCTAADLGTNPDCAEFYDAAGRKTYRLKSHLVYASNTCKNYRNTIDGASLTYHMVPNQGISCQASDVGCRAYKGNAGDNVRQLYVESFENGSISPWVGSVTYSNESVTAGGHSMLVANSGAINNVGTRLGFVGDHSYLISFWAKSAVSSDTPLTFSLSTNPALVFNGQAVAKAGDWSRFQVGPLFIPAGTALDTVQLLAFSANAFYLDTITITEVVDSIYLIKGSATSCSGYEGCEAYKDRSNNVSYLKSFTRLCSEEKVGCEQMADTKNTDANYGSDFHVESYLRGDLNGDGVVGQADLTMMRNGNATCANVNTGSIPRDVIDVDGDAVYNCGAAGTDTVYLSNYLTSGGPAPTPAYYFIDQPTLNDSYRFLVNDQKKSCAAANAGCQRLGKPVLAVDGSVASFQDAYLVNDPDQYAANLCYFNESSCREYTSAGGSKYYFKDPGTQLCEYKLLPGQNAAGWYKKGTTQGTPDCPASYGVCAGGGVNDGKACNSADDCDSGSCIRNPNIASQPVDSWVGECPASANSCTEYRDPEEVLNSEGNTTPANYIQNGDFELFDATANAATATDGVKDAPFVPDHFTNWNTQQTDAGFCNVNPAITCDVNADCPSGTCNTAARAPCGNRLVAVGDAHSGTTAALYRSYSRCAHPTDPALYQWYGFDTGALTDNRSFEVSFFAQRDSNDPDCAAGSPNADIFYQLERQIDDRSPGGYGDYLTGYTQTVATGGWQKMSGVFTFAAVPMNGRDWVSTSGPVEDQQRFVNLIFRRPADGPGMCNLVIDDMKVTEKVSSFNFVPYYYLSDTVDQSSCNGLVGREEGCRLFDDTSNSDVPYSSASSVNGQAPAACTPSAGDCDANSVIKVRPDRECKRWLECETSIQQANKDGKTEDLCLSRYICDALDPQTGHCTNAVDYERVNQTYSTPAFASLIKNYSGLAYPGLEWGRRCLNNPNIICTADVECGSGGTCSVDPQIIEGRLPTATMTEVGSVSINGNLIDHGDLGDGDYATNQKLSFQLTGGDPTPPPGRLVTPPFPVELSLSNPTNLSANWLSRPRNGGTATIWWTEENTNDGTIPSTNPSLDENNVARVVTSGKVGAGNGQEQGIAYDLGHEIIHDDEYYVSFRLRFASPPSVYDRIRVEFGHRNRSGAEIAWPRFADITPTAEWQEYTFGPVKAGYDISGNFVDYETTQLNILHWTDGVVDAPPAEFFVDDLELTPVLQTQEEGGLISRDCRLYPKSDSPGCTYTDENNTTFKGWQGYCLEHDPLHPKYCLSWWPVDLLRGESNVFATLRSSGYSGRRPLYACLNAAGNYNIPKTIWGVNQNTTFTRQAVNDTILNRDNGGDDCGVGDFPISPLFGQPYMYRAPMSTAIIDQTGWGTCNQAGNMSGNVPPSNCAGTKSGICGSRDEDGNIFNSVYDADVQDRYYKWQIEYINFTLQRWSHPDWNGCAASSPDGLIIYTLNNDSTCSGGGNCWSGAYSCGGNIIDISVNFDATDRLTSYSVRMYDSNNGGGAWVQGIFHLRDECTTIAKVVDQTGDQAWFQRTERSSSFEVPTLLYHYAQDFAPYGGIIQPEPVASNPTNWGWNAGGGPGPLFIEHREAQDVARAGSPYSFATPAQSPGRMCSTLVSGSTYSRQNECRNKADVDKCFLGADNSPGTDDDGYCIGTGIGFCQKDSSRFCTPATQTNDCTVSGADYGPCLVGVCTGGTNNAKYCGGTCTGGTNTGRACVVNADCPGSTCDMSIGSCPNGGTCTAGGGAANVTTADQARLLVERLFANAYGVWTWDAATGRYVLEDANNPATLIARWQADYRAMSVCPYSSGKGQADRPAYPNDYCGVPPLVHNFLIGSGGQMKQDTFFSLQGGGTVQLSFTVTADPQQKAVKEIRVNWGDGSPEYVTVGNYDSGTISISHQYNIIGSWRPRIKVIDNWDWCGVPINAGATSCTGAYDCRYQADTDDCSFPGDLPNFDGYVDTGITVQVTP